MRRLHAAPFTLRCFAACRWAAEARKCPFATLGVSDTAELPEVRTAYRNLCKTHHPDVGGCENKFKEIHSAYEECKERIDLGAPPASSSSGQSTSGTSNDHDQHGTTGGEHERTAGREGFAEDGWEAFKERRRHEKGCQQRDGYRERFEAVTNPDQIDALLDEAMSSGAFSTQDVGEPLGLALARFHVELGLGAVHAERCFNAIDRWEHTCRRKAGPHYYHVLLTLYSNEAFMHHCDAMTVTETVSSILERMSVKGLPHDDWTIMLANRVFRAVPFPDW